MTIYMTHSKFAASAAALDKVRLDLQIIIVGKTLKVLEGDPTEVKSHSEMTIWSWNGYNAALAWYGQVLCNAWLQWVPTTKVVQRNRQAAWFNAVYEDNIGIEANHDRFGEHPNRIPPLPPWMGDKNVHRSHRSNLICKLPQHYESEFPKTPEDMPHLHPQIIQDGTYRLRLTTHELGLLKSGERKLPDNLRYDENKNEVLEVG